MFWAGVAERRFATVFARRIRPWPDDENRIRDPIKNSRFVTHNLNPCVGLFYQTNNRARQDRGHKACHQEFARIPLSLILAIEEFVAVGEPRRGDTSARLASLTSICCYYLLGPRRPAVSSSTVGFPISGTNPMLSEVHDVLAIGDRSRAARRDAI